MTNYEQVDGAAVNKDLNKTIQEKGGTGQVFARSAEAMSLSLFDLKTNELYKVTGGVKNQRKTLPKEAQKALIAGETVANHDLKSQDIQGSPSQKNQRIVQSVSNSGKKVRKLFPW